MQMAHPSIFMASRLSPKAMAEPTMTMTRLAVLATLWEAAEAQGLTSAETHGRREADAGGVPGEARGLCREGARGRAWVVAEVFLIVRVASSLYR